MGGAPDMSSGETAGESAGALAGELAGISGGEPAGALAGESTEITAGEAAGETAGSPTNDPPIFSSERRHTQQFDFTYDRSVTSGNPLKGFLTSYLWGTPSNDLPHSLEFGYFAFAEISDAPERYDFETSIEPHLQSASERGHHMILRVYLDYPSRESGVPSYLSDAISCTPYPEYGGGCSPDYGDPILQSAILDFIRAFGARYDGDQRVAFIQVGLLGFWGEWHTYPHTAWFADDAFQQSVITAFDEAFDYTPIQLRIPAQDSPQRSIGFHDDSFARSTTGDVAWYFWPKLLAASADQQWEVAPMGGEVYPPYQGSLFTDAYTVDGDHQDPLVAIETTHMSYLLNYLAFNMDGVGYTGDQRIQAERAANAMGYELTVERVSVEASRLQGDQVSLNVSVALRSSGVAPFYYPLSLSLTSLESERLWSLELAQSVTRPAAEPQELTFELPAVDVSTLTRGFTLRLDSPHLLEGQVIRWANREQAEGVLTIPSVFVCDLNESTISLADAVEHPQGQCFCDVDGRLYTASGVRCTP